MALASAATALIVPPIQCAKAWGRVQGQVHTATTGTCWALPTEGQKTEERNCNNGVGMRMHAAAGSTLLPVLHCQFYTAAAGACWA